MLHRVGARLYYDGANFNAIMGRARPGDMGFDVVHMNLHKTFATPHGGGGPGSGPVAVTAELVRYLPGPRPVRRDDGAFDWGSEPESIGRVHGWHGNVGIDVRAYSYLLALGGDGLRRVSEMAVLNANYLLAQLAGDYDVPYPGPVLHEFVLSARRQKKVAGVRALDIAKGLIDRRIHPMTVYFPLIVEEAMMIEPTETENRETLDEFVAVMRALAGLDLRVPTGTVLGVLGPNGAGKTTAVRIFTTLLRPDAGRAEVAGYDVVRDAAKLRANIGLTGQYAAVDEYLTGRENIEMVGRLYHLSRRDAQRKAEELLDRFDLTAAGSRTVKTYSGGMRRRLDLAASLVITPPVIFLDEPTTGLDPRSRLGMWDVIEELVADGVTLLLTTQYLEEADRLADSIAVVDGGRVIARGTADELKTQVGGDRIEVVVGAAAELTQAVRALEPHLGSAVTVDADTRRITGPAHGGAGQLAAVVRDLDAVGVRIDDLALRRPTLDDVFLALTGHAAAEATAPDIEAEPTRRRRRRSA